MNAGVGGHPLYVRDMYAPTCGHAASSFFWGCANSIYPLFDRFVDLETHPQFHQPVGRPLFGAADSLQTDLSILRLILSDVF